MTWVKTQDPSEPIFFILYQNYISLQDGTKKKQVGLILLKFAYLTVEPNREFTITTPRDNFTFQVGHQTAKEEWIALLREYMPTEELTNKEATGPDQPTAQPALLTVPSKSRSIKMALVIIEQSGSTDKKKNKIKK